MLIKKSLSSTVAVLREKLRFFRFRMGWYKKMRRDISHDETFGRILTALATCPQFSNYVEIGTAHGLGSTQPIVNGLLSRSDECCLWSLESVSFLHAMAVKNWQDVNTRKHLILLHGTATPADQMMTWEDVLNDPNYDSSKNVLSFSSYQKNRRTQSTAPDAMPHLPAEIDVLLLDGGEFSSYGEYKALGGRAKIICLDDSFSAIKNRRTREDLLNDKEWTCTVDKPKERNGWSVFCRKEFSHLLTDLCAPLNHDNS